MNDSKKIGDSGGGLNLGLGAILDPSVPGGASRDSIEKVIDIEERVERLLSERAQEAGELSDPVSRVRNLWKKGEISEIIKFCDRGSEVFDDSQLWIAKLWWVRAQLVTGELPIGILAAPLEAAVFQGGESCAEICDQNKKEMAEILSESAQQLSEAGEYQLAVKFFKKMQALTQSDPSQSDPSQSERSPSESDKEFYEAVCFRLEELKSFRGRKRTAETEELLKLQKQLKQSEAVEGSEDKVTKEGGARSRRLELATLIVVAIVASIWVYRFTTRYSLTAPAEHPGWSESGIVAIEPEYRLEDIDILTLMQTEKLDNLLDQLDKGIKKAPSKKAETTSPSIQEGGDVSGGTKVISTTSAGPVDAAAKSVVNTESPSEPDELRQMRKGFSELSSQEAEGTGSFMNTPRGDNIVEGFKVPGAEAIKNAPPVRVSTAGSRTGIVQRATWIRAQPSEMSRGVQYVFRGNRIMIEKSSGEWFQVRGVTDEKGYVIKSAVMIED